MELTEYKGMTSLVININMLLLIYKGKNFSNYRILMSSVRNGYTIYYDSLLYTRPRIHWIAVIYKKRFYLMFLTYTFIHFELLNLIIWLRVNHRAIHIFVFTIRICLHKKKRYVRFSLISLFGIARSDKIIAWVLQSKTMTSKLAISKSRIVCQHGLLQIT